MDPNAESDPDALSVQALVTSARTALIDATRIEAVLIDANLMLWPWNASGPGGSCQPARDLQTCQQTNGDAP